MPNHAPSRPSHLCDQTYAMVLAGGRGKRLGPLTDRRAKPAVPFAGKLKIIDFALSNCVSSGIRHIGVLTQYKAQSLIRHIERGWGFLAATLGEYVDVVPAQQQQGEAWYAGTADAVAQNTDLIRESGARWVLVLAGDHVYKMDYSVMLAEHVARGGGLTVACTVVPRAQASSFGVMQLAEDGSERILAFDEKPAEPAPLRDHADRSLVSMGIYVFDAELLLAELARDAADPASSHDFGHDLLPTLVQRGLAWAHRFERSCVNTALQGPYWRDDGTVDAYYDANMDLIEVVPQLNLYDDAWPVLSQQRQLSPAKFVFDDDARRGHALQSLVASGCIVSGATVRRSILFSKVRVEEGSQIDDSLLLPNAACGRGVVLRRCIVDKHCRLPDGFVAGLDPALDRERGFHVTPGGVTLVTPEMIGQTGRIG
ncbi:MAG: glucose-1-phosphate adenylyltransferase [Rubrivivax sp.]|nr:glucose-1-phosphate adenylyltransferase [Rubrivivax sp.]